MSSVSGFAGNFLMSSHMRISRRRFGQGLAVSGALVASGISSGTAFADGVTVDDWKQIVALSDEARKLGIDAPQLSVPQAGTPQFDEIVRIIVDFIDDLDQPAASLGTNAAAGASIKKRAQALLNSVNGRERSPHHKSELPSSSLFSLAGLIGAAQAETVDPSQRYDRYKAGYLELFDSCKVRPERQSTVDWYVSKLTNPKYRAAYEKLEDDICVPWYFIGVLHALEASFNFDAHLHNGDPLSRRTTHVPAGRPLVWQPPSDWQSSAKDALALEKFTEHLDWNLARMLFRIEAYNGFRSRELHNTNSPYLWSFSNHYTAGKFVADNEWSSTTVSQQCGAAVMIKALVDKKIIQLIV
jgi:lysozyme family protein